MKVSLNVKRKYGVLTHRVSYWFRVTRHAMDIRRIRQTPVLEL